MEATKAALAQIKTLEPVLNCYVTVDEEGALKRAEEVQKQIEDGTLTVLWPVFRWRSKIICVRRDC